MSKFQIQILLAGFLASASAHAQTNSQIVADEVVVTASRFEEKPDVQPIGVQVITAGQIHDSGVRTLPELLSRQAGVYTRDNSGSPNQQIDMRGFGVFGDQNTLILVDGQRISENEQIPADLASIPLSSVERIEIMRGSGAVLYGGGATGGTINIITRGPKPNSAEGEIAAGYGTYATSDLAAGARLGGEKVGIAVNANQYDSNNYRANNAIRQRNLHTDFHYYGENGPIYLKLGSGEQDLRLPGPRTQAQLAGDRRGTANPNDHSELRTTRVNLGTSQSLSFGELAADLTYRERDSFALNDPGSADIQGNVTTFSPRLKIPFSFWGGHAVVTGIDWDRWGYSYTQSFPGFSSSAKSDQNNSAFFIKDTVSIGNGTRVSLGGRVQRVETTVQDLSFGSPDINQVRRPRSWEFALRQDVDTTILVYAKTGQSFRVANVDDSRGLAAPLEPQTSHDFEIGSEYHRENARFRAAAYRMNIKNEIAFLPGDLVPPFGANINLPPTLREGFELEGDWKVGAWLTFLASYTYTVARFVEGTFAGVDVSGKNVPLVPRNRISIGATVTPAARLRLTMLVTHVGEQYYDNDQSNTFGRKMPDYTVVDVSANYDYRNWTLSASVHNLFNADYYTYAIRSLSAPTFNAYPSAERAVFLSTEYRFGR